MIETFACARFLGVEDVPYVVAPYGLDDDAFEGRRTLHVRVSSASDGWSR